MPKLPLAREILREQDNKEGQGVPAAQHCQQTRKSVQTTSRLHQKQCRTVNNCPRFHQSVSISHRHQIL